MKKNLGFICSDFHLDSFLYNPHVPDDIKIGFWNRMPDVDTIIVAGDLSSHDLVERDIELLCLKYKNVVFVPGNHEYYDSSFSEINAKLSNIKLENFHYLNNREITINNTRILGTTLWFRDAPENKRLEKYMGDFEYIKNFRKEVYEENSKAVEFLRASKVDENCIIVSHHLPSFMSVSKAYLKSPLNGFFLCSMDGFISERNPKMWIHGHTHNSHDYLLGKTRVVCNPFGYISGVNRNFSFNKIIEL